jgi:hypothetical protein
VPKGIVGFKKRKVWASAILALAVGMLGIFLTLVATFSQSAGPDLPERHPRLESTLRHLVAAHNAGDVSAMWHSLNLVEGLVQVVVVQE